LALAACLGVFTGPASAAAIGFTGTGGFVVAGGIGGLTGLCQAGCDSGFVPFTTGAQLADGMVISGNIRQVVQENGAGNTASALLLVTNILATNFGPNTISDTMFIASDQFAPSVAGPVGVGISGAFLSNAGVFGNISFASTQAAMHFLTTGIITQANFGGPLTGFSLFTESPFVSCIGCSPVGFWASTFGFDQAGGVEQLIGAINFTLGPGASIALPGSFMIENNNNAAITAETPEPAAHFRATKKPRSPFPGARLKDRESILS
jgi:hypothetical protein